MVELPRAFVFGIDGATFDLIDPLVAEGHLPNLAKLLAVSASAKTDCTWPAHTGPGWVSLVAAGHPGHHAIYQFFDVQEPRYRARIVGSSDCGCSTAWDWLVASGYSLGLVNVPMSHPPRHLPGYQITWPLMQTLHYAEPRSLLGELARAGSHFKSDLAAMYRGNIGYIHEALANVDARVRSMKYLLRTHPVDVVMMVLTEADRVCHHYWHFSDVDHPRYTHSTEDVYRNAIRHIYESIDWALGEILSQIPDSCSVLVVSDHGFGPGHQSFSVHRWLSEVGLLAAQSTNGSSGGEREQASWFTERDVQVDWERTQVYMPVPGSFSLNVNQRGRQRQGIVNLADVEFILEDVTAALVDLRIPSNGRRVFSRILRREEAFSGMNSYSSPDLLLIPADESLMVTPSLIDETWSASYQTGLHRHEGMWIHRSPGVRAGRLDFNIQLIDIFPTLLAELGVSIPCNVPGKVISRMFRTAPVDQRSKVPVFSEVANKEQPDWGDDMLTKRLKDMGYL